MGEGSARFRTALRQHGYRQILFACKLGNQKEVEYLKTLFLRPKDV